MGAKPLYPVQAQPSRLKGLSSSLYAATRGSTENYEFLEDGITLQVRGMIFDSIQNVWKMPVRSKNMTSDHLERVVLEWRPLVFSWLAKINIDQRYERLMRTLTCDRDICGKRLASNVNGLDWGMFFRIEHLDVGARREFEFLAASVRRSTFEGAANDETGERLAQFVQRIDWEQANIVMTSSGRVGLGLAETQPGDMVCLIMGLDVPFVLRHIDADLNISVGEAYIYEALDGEILTDGNIEPKYIKLQ